MNSSQNLPLLQEEEGCRRVRVDPLPLPPRPCPPDPQPEEGEGEGGVEPVGVEGDTISPSRGSIRTVAPWTLSGKSDIESEPTSPLSHGEVERSLTELCEEIDLPYSNPLFLTFYLVAISFEFCFVTFPDFLCRLVPGAGFLLSAGMLYIFLQAVALLWVFIVDVILILAVSSLKWKDENSIFWCDPPGEGEPCLTSEGAVRVCFKGYVYFTIVRMAYFAGKSFWQVGWEAYGDFPSARVLLDPRQHQYAKRPRGFSRGVRTYQRILLIAPLVVLFLTAVVISLIPFLSELYESNTGMKGDWWVFPHLSDNTSRLNRTLRFTVFLGLLQWSQQFHSLFPLWFHALFNANSVPIGLCIAALGPLTSFRLLQWFLFPTGPSTIPSLFGLAHHKVDCLLLIGWGGLLLYSALMILMLPPEELRLAGWQRKIFLDESLWCKQTMRLKFMCLIPCMLHFFRGFISSKMGFTFAQNDLIIITLAYPLLLVLVWSLTSAAVIVRPRHLLLLLPFFVVSFFITSFARVGGAGAFLAVLVHLCRQGVKIIAASREARSKAADFTPDTVGTPSVGGVGPRQTYGFARAAGGNVVRVFVGVMVVFISVVVCLGVLSQMQTDNEFYPTSSFITLTKEESYLKVSHAIMELHLFEEEGSKGPEWMPTYAICQNSFWGLSIIDYGMLSLAAYFGPDEIQNALDLFFPKEELGWGAKAIKEVGEGGGEPTMFDLKDGAKEVGKEGKGGKVKRPSSVFWAEIDLAEKNLTILTVKGTEFWRASDYIEDLRMWAEPVMISMISTFFPTVRMWSAQTTAMFLDALNEVFEMVGLSDPPFKYAALIDHIRKSTLPRAEQEGHQVVITGHSLGGGIAQIAAAVTHLPVVAFSPPGTYQSLSKHLYHSAKERRQTHEASHNRTVTIIAENDAIAKLFDSHGGLVQTITCNTDQLSPVGCHMSENSICNLIRHCKNDPRWKTCKFNYQPFPMFQGLVERCWESLVQGEVVLFQMVGAVALTAGMAVAALRWVVEII